eukprot:scaffold10025_cov180-Amphora_coffeaeformis.AAC.13
MRENLDSENATSECSKFGKSFRYTGSANCKKAAHTHSVRTTTMMSINKFVLLLIVSFDTVSSFVLPLQSWETTSTARREGAGTGVQEQTKNIKRSSRTILSSASSDDDDDDDSVDNSPTTSSAVNVLGTPLKCCCCNVGGTGIGTGFYRNGYCATGEQDLGRHTVCVEVTDDFLAYSKSVGNDLSTRMPEYLFPGLKNGDIWCLCAERWRQAFEAGKAPQVYLQRTHEKTLTYVPFDTLLKFALDADEVDEKLNELNQQRAKLNKLLGD